MILPPQEVELLNSITLDALTIRVRDLHLAGWSLQSIGDALIPPRRKTTVRSWVMRAGTSSYAPHEVIDAPTPNPGPKLSNRASKPEPSTISPTDLQQLRDLAPLARQFRSGMSPSSAPAIANARLSTLAKALYQNGVSLKDLALHANVTYRAMYKRVQPPRKNKTSHKAPDTPVNP